MISRIGSVFLHNISYYVTLENKQICFKRALELKAGADIIEKVWPMELFYCQINNRSVQQVVSSAGLRVICVVLHTSNVCQVVAVLLQAYNNTLTLQVIRSRRSKATTPALHSEELLYYLAYKKIDYYQAASHRWVPKYCVAIMLHHIREEANSVVHVSA